MRVYKSLALCVMFLVLLTACATVGNPSVASEEVTSQVQIGVSTKEDVKRLFGAPTVVSRSAMAPGLAVVPGLPLTSGVAMASQSSVVYEVWNYTYSNVETSPVTFIPIVGLFAGSATAHTASLTVTFDNRGIVQSVLTGQSQATGGPGAGMYQ
jgi:outer membrane protein assembly factor BamE (lipoprotein component of BamABCDE complex)